MPSAEFLAFVRQLRENPMPTELAAMRSAYEGMGQVFAIPDDAEVRPATLGGRPAEWYGEQAARQADTTILYLHGGGYAIGSLTTHRHLGVEIATQTKIPTVALDYRLGPEHPFPAAVDDGLAAYKQLLTDHPDRKFAFAGDSAGAGLVMATLVAARDAGLPLPECAYCMSPWADLTVSGTTLESKAAIDPLASRGTLELMAQRYLKDADPRDAAASPIFADLRGLPPIFIQVGTAEVLLDDAIRLAKAAGEANVEVTLEICPDMVHVWPFFFPAFPEARSALSRACRFLKEALAHSRPAER